MYLHLDTNTVIRTREIVAILDIENSSVSKITREFFAAAQSRGEIIYLNGTELPKSFLLCESDGVGRVYVSHLAPSTLRRRVENTAAALRWLSLSHTGNGGGQPARLS